MLGRRPTERASRLIAWSVFAVVLCLAAVVAFSVIAERSQRTSRAAGAHPSASSASSGSDPSRSTPNPSARVGHDMVMRQPGGGRELGHSEKRALVSAQEKSWPQLARVRASVQWRTRADLVAAGYEELMPESTHLVNWDLVDDRIDLDRPEMFMVSGNEPGERIVAAVYWVEGAQPDGLDGIDGPPRHWHPHPGVCSIHGQSYRDLPDLDHTCVKRGGALLTSSGWMLHAWVILDYPNPDGVFAVNNDSIAAPR